MTIAFMSGFALSLSLILAIGAQNAFVLRQGLRGEHVFAVALTCALSDAVLIGAGVAGFGALIGAAPWLAGWMRWAGAAFLVVYGTLALHAALRSDAVLDPAAGGGAGLGRTLAVCLLLTWANPHVYLDTLVLLGSVSTGYGDRAAIFGLGAAFGAFVFFFALAYGARALRPLFARPAAWRLLDAFVGMTMWTIAAALIAG